jgi:hypothetical protein
VHWPRHKVQIFSSEGSSSRPAFEEESTDDCRRRRRLDQSFSSPDITGMTAVLLLQIPMLFGSAASRILVQSPTVSRMWTEQSARPHLQNQNLQHLAIPSSGDCMFLMHLIVDEDGDKFTMELILQNKPKRSCVVASLCSARSKKAVARRWPQQAALTNVGFYSFHIRSFLPLDPPSSFDPYKFRPSRVFVFFTLIVTLSLETRLLLHCPALPSPPPYSISVLPISKLRSRETVVLLLCP